ncbi:1-(5-phosphoribosyl)-5-((5-phosphoribosylamino)methylideneamino)imidazole-4-carboxamide isomerase, partial [Buchnera aphidicola]|nr:1-(5-phosphoribosyl)-5-((5-phosphoribosylamino)methylideneamino)imidazole-4-carboxamide isomerase [Buchnera aphidicola]
MIIPAFDFMQNKVLRLYQGDYSQKKYYDINIYDVLKKYYKYNVKIVHLVDLDGAKNNNNRQLEFFKTILSYNIIDVQIGGGIRNEQDINLLL